MTDTPSHMEPAVELACSLLNVESIGDELRDAIAGAEVYRHLAASHHSLKTVNEGIGYRSDRGNDEYSGLAEQLRLDARRELGEIIAEENVALETFFGVVTLYDETGRDDEHDMLVVDNGFTRQRYDPDNLTGYDPELGEEVWVTREFDEEQIPDLPDGHTIRSTTQPRHRPDIVAAHVKSEAEREAEKREEAPARHR